MQQYRRVSEPQRYQIEVLIEIGKSISEISFQLKLHRSTIYREIRRNVSSQQIYRASVAEKLAQKRRQSCARKRLFNSEDKLRTLHIFLAKGWSPGIIAGRLGLSSHQTIYNEIKKYRRDLRPFLYRYDRRSGVKRKSRRPEVAKPFWMKPIAERPPAAERRDHLGHWERDSVMVKDREMLLVCLERSSRFVKLAKLNKRSFKDVARKTRKLIHVGKQKPLTITNDNGTEFMDKGKTGIPTYYCDPYSPQQRGSVENVIRILRNDLTRQTSIHSLTNKDLRSIEDKLNHRPRKILGYRTPHEVIYQKRVALGS